MVRPQCTLFNKRGCVCERYVGLRRVAFHCATGEEFQRIVSASANGLIPHVPAELKACPPPLPTRFPSWPVLRSYDPILDRLEQHDDEKTCTAHTLMIISKYQKLMTSASMQRARCPLCNSLLALSQNNPGTMEVSF
jgi:hypothetical protein